MNLVLETTAGPATGRCFAVGDGEVVTFGRTEDSRCVLTEDDQLSRRHFAVRFDAEAEMWQLRDLESRHGTKIDGEPIDEGHFYAGSTVTAGRSTFRTREASDEEVTPEALAAVAAGLVLFTAVAASNRKPDGLPDVKRQKVHTGLPSWVSESDTPAPASIAWMIAQNCPMYLLADFAKASVPFPHQLEQREYLFNWADDEVLASFSPLVLGPDDSVDPYEIIDALWGKDCVVCVFSKLERQQLVTQLRSSIRGDDGLSREVPKALTGTCWPEALRSMLSTAPPRLTAPLLEGNQIYLVEGEPPSCWQAFSTKESESTVRKSLDL